MKGVKIKELNLLGKNDSGSTFNLEPYQAKGYLLAYRNEGSVSGNHYHKGNSKGKNPERLLLISGSIQLYVQHVVTNKIEETTVNAPVMIEIEPNILHKVTALTAISFLEFNSLDEHKADTYYL